jgi:hypothetical protein
MGKFKIWLAEITVGSDGTRDNTPTQTAQATQAVANKWMANPQNADVLGQLTTVANQHPSALHTPLLDAGAKAVQKAGGMARATTAPSVAKTIGTNLGLPTNSMSFIKPPRPSQVKMMARP